MTDSEQQLWYVRRGSTIQGPYDVGQLQRFLLLGRVRLTDRASRDGETWYALTQCAELIPDEMRDLDSEAGRARFEAARRAVDERQDDEPDDDGVPGGERADDLPATPGPPLRWPIIGLAVVVAAVLSVVGLSGQFGTRAGAARTCNAAPAPGVNWSYCAKNGVVVAPGTNLSGANALHASLRGAQLAGVQLTGATLAHADLSGADLHDADLTGADLRAADLSNADLRGAILTDADLSHADLRGARIEGATFDGAELEGAVWVDGRPCLGEGALRCPR